MIDDDEWEKISSRSVQLVNGANPRWCLYHLSRYHSIIYIDWKALSPKVIALGYRILKAWIMEHLNYSNQQPTPQNAPFVFLQGFSGWINSRFNQIAFFPMRTPLASSAHPKYARLFKSSRIVSIILGTLHKCFRRGFWKDCWCRTLCIYAVSTHAV